MIRSPLFCSVCGAANEPVRQQCCACGHLLEPEKEQANTQNAPPLQGRYLLGELLGEGGFSQVYRGYDQLSGGRTVAVKAISLQGLNAQEAIEATETFHREMRMLSALTHPQVPRVYDHFSDQKHWYLILQYIEGQTLETFLTERETQGLPLRLIASTSNATSTPDGNTAQVWDAATGRTILTYQGANVGSVVWSPDGKHIASLSLDDSAVKIWDTTTGRTILTYPGPIDNNYGVAWSPDSKRLATVSFDNHKVQIWDAATGRTIFAYDLDNQNDLLVSQGIGVAWSPNGKRFASITGSNTVQVRDNATGRMILTYPANNSLYAGNPWTVMWSPDGRYITSVYGDNTIQVWKAP